jgi:hypothetical protein
MRFHYSDGSLDAIICSLHAHLVTEIDVSTNLDICSRSLLTFLSPLLTPPTNCKSFG